MDPAVGEYIPTAGGDNSKLPAGGVFTNNNLSLYHYANNNPVKYTDPTGMFDFDTNTVEPGDTLNQIATDCNERYGTNYTAEDLQKLNPNITDVNKIYAGDNLNLGVENNQDDGSFSSWFFKQNGESLTLKESKIQKNWGIAEMIAGPIFSIGACEATEGESVLMGLEIMADGAAMIAYAVDQKKLSPFVIFTSLICPVTATIDNRPYCLGIIDPSKIMPRYR